MRRLLNSLMIAAATVSLAACGGGGGGGGGGGSSSGGGGDGGTSEPLTGRFVDAAVAGIGYRTSSGLAGKADQGGYYSYRAGDSVTFAIGNITLGSGAAAELMTPVSIVPEAKGDASNTKVVNIARLLQTLDNDGDPSNGIELTAATTTAAEALPDNAINLEDAAEFEATAGSLIDELTAGNTVPVAENQLVSAEAAQAHLEASLGGQEYQGGYSGSFAHSDLAAFQFTISETGQVSGTADSASVGSLTLSGTVDSQGALTVAMTTAAGQSYGAIAAAFDADGGIAGSATLTGSTSAIQLTGSAASSTWDAMTWDKDPWG